VSAPSHDWSSSFADTALRRLSEKWTARVLSLLTEGPLHFGPLRRKLGTSAKVLISTLRGLERDGFISRTESLSVRLQVTYDVTPLGRALLKLHGTIGAWARRYERTARSRLESGTRVTTGPGRATSRDVRRESPRLDAVPTHLCLAVVDLDRASTAFSQLFGVEAGDITYGTVTAPDHRQGQIRRLDFKLSNFGFELMEPTQGSSAFSDFLRGFGQGVHHIGFRTIGELATQIRHVEHKGGRRTAGGLPDKYALFDFGEQFGPTLELVEPELDAWVQRTLPLTEMSPARRWPVSHVGIIVRDVQEAAALYSDVTGFGTSPVSTVSPAFPPHMRIGPGATARVVKVRQGGISMFLIEPIGSSPWSDFLEQHGNAVHHVSFNVGSRLTEIARGLRRRGVKQVLGRPGVGYAHFDLQQDFGLVVGLLGQ
jgi:DNA-binding HxlR family transcriptional regulator/catechol 2,3-dioxygenase-like lactoylglutathione lyase family enzyme